MDLQIQELELKKLKQKMMSEYSSLPPDAKEAKQRVMELEHLVRLLAESVEGGKA